MTWPQGWLPKIADLQIELYSLMFTADEWARRVATKIGLAWRALWIGFRGWLPEQPQILN